jgi:hypothetical protein
MNTPSFSSSPAAQIYRSVIDVTRLDLCGSLPDRQMPVHLSEDAQVPFLGFAGPNYRPGGVLLLAINPGGGTEKYIKRPPQDAELIPYILAFMASEPPVVESSFTAMSSSYMKQAKTWNLWGIVQPVLDACSKGPDEVAFANVFPFRTYKDHKPHSVPLRNAIIRITKPLVAGLGPSTIVVLGKKAGDALHAHSLALGRCFIVPRTNGDRYVSAEAMAVLAALRQHAA